MIIDTTVPKTTWGASTESFHRDDCGCGQCCYELSEFRRNNEICGCLHAKLGRGDCFHFLGIPEREDEYGRPLGWCEICWRGEQIKRLKACVYLFAKNYGGHEYALSNIAVALRDRGWANKMNGL